MPLEYKTYGCRFKCGIKHKSDYSQIRRHEDICWYNPEVRSCLTCRHGELNRGCYDPISGPEESYRDCYIDDTIEFDGIKPNTFCEKWEAI